MRPSLWARLLRLLPAFAQPRRMPDRVLLSLPLCKWRALLVGTVGLAALQTLQQQIYCTTVRKVYTQNYALVREKYERDRTELADRALLANKLGYPDGGDNLYADELPE